MNSFPIDPTDIEVLRFLGEICNQQSVEWILVGAMARDIQLQYRANVSAGRVTNDIDIAVAVDSWESFAILVDALTRTAQFARTRSAHKLVGTEGGPFVGREVDIVPFGGVESEGSAIRWPPDGAIVMSVVGFEEALATCETVRIENFSVRVASVPALAALKLLAWLDRRMEDSKDAVDFERIIRTYEHVIGEERMYEGREYQILEAVDFDREKAGAQILGAHVASACALSTVAVIKGLLQTDMDRNLLIAQMDAGKVPSGERLQAPQQIEFFEKGLLGR
jgi:predicted nucleotidyltransferase